MSPVDFKKCQCCMLNLRNSPVASIGKPCFMSIGPLSHLEFKKRTCPHTCAYFCNTGRDHQKLALRHVRWEFQPNMAVHEQSVSALAD